MAEETSTTAADGQTTAMAAPAANPAGSAIATPPPALPGVDKTWTWVVGGTVALFAALVVGVMLFGDEEQETTSTSTLFNTEPGLGKYLSDVVVAEGKQRCKGPSAKLLAEHATQMAPLETA